MRVTSSFECGNGKNIEKVVPGQFRFEEVGEEPPYCKYFCVRIEAEGDGGRIRLDVYPDPSLGERGRAGMMGHYPSQIWFSTDDKVTWQPIENVLDGVLRFYETHLSLEVRVEPHSVLYVASNPVMAYSHLVAWAQALADRPGSRCQHFALGQSFEGRDIPVIHLPASAPKAKRVFVLAGQHPSEHCGVLAAVGVAEFLVSTHPEANELRSRYEFFLCPMINVDGNVHGRNGLTMEDINMSSDFAGASTGAPPRAAEDRLLWRWLEDEVQPEISLHFHGYMGKRGFIDPPYDGLYAFPDPAKVYGNDDRLPLYRAMTDSLAWDTDGLTGHGRPSPLGEASLDFNLARSLGTLTAFYEINHGYHGVWASKRKGARVLRTALRAFSSPAANG